MDMKARFLTFVTLIAATTVFFPAMAMGQRAGAKVDQQVLRAEELLSQKGYWILKVDGVTDASTRHAVIAFQKVEGLKRNGVISSSLISALEGALRPAVRYSIGQHVEIDLTRQVLFLVEDGGMVTHVLPVSSGTDKPYYEQGKRQVAHTPRGSFKIYRQIKGVRHAPLGTLYYPNYISGGVAIHGSGSVPAFPASHGCIRIPRFADKVFSSMVHVGMPVYVYD